MKERRQSHWDAEERAPEREKSSKSDTDSSKENWAVFNVREEKQSNTDMTVTISYTLPCQCLIHCACNFLICMKIIWDSLKIRTKLFSVPKKHSILNAKLSGFITTRCNLSL